MLTFRYGPNNWCMESVGQKMGYARYIPKAGEDEIRKAAIRRQQAAMAAGKAPAAAPARPAVRPVGKAPSYDALPPAPERYPVHPHQRSKAELQGELEMLDEWLTKTASLFLSMKDIARREIATERADELYTLAMMAR